MTDEQPASSRTLKKFTDDDPQLPEFVKWVNAVDQDAWLNYLCECGFNSHLGRFIGSNPFDDGTHASRRMHVLIAQFLRPNYDQVVEFTRAIQLYIHANNLIQERFKKYHTVDELYGPRK
ncbi:MAG: hypothetical protein PHX43_02085 [Alphaproteobacteria bacterium]|nr:hypothetical protein [Alphaproteobacteria bacterium]